MERIRTWTLEPMAKAWINQRERGSSILMRLYACLSLTFGRNASRAFLPFIVFYYLILERKARQASREFLYKVLGESIGCTHLYRHFHTFGSTILDRIFFWSGRYKEFQVTTEGEEALFECLKESGGCILLGSHLGSFEIVRVLGMTRQNIKIYMLMVEDEARKISRRLEGFNAEMAEQIIPIGTANSLLGLTEIRREGALLEFLEIGSLMIVTL